MGVRGKRLLNLSVPGQDSGC
uniref:Uncharacterized protein n=1 Tax=Anguilla anguilla TaxID=7936 RepID=A0A0E9RT82_ANGAN